MKRINGEGYGPGVHRWSGWPGAFCLYCGAEDQNELALADGCEPNERDLNKSCEATQERRDELDYLMNPEWFEK